MNRATNIISAFLTTTCLVVGASAVSAADLKSGRDSAAKFNQVPVATWTGFYAGVNAGYGQNAFKDKDAGSNGSFRQRGALAGITLGYNYEFANRIVLGVEGDYAWSGMKKTKRETQLFGFGRVESSDKAETSSLSTLRLRAGYSFGSFMPYVTGGLAVINSRIDNKFAIYPNVGAVFNDNTHASATKVGYALGAGVEAMITSNISLKAEYIYAGFETQSYFSSGTKYSNSIQTGRVGLNYRF